MKPRHFIAIFLLVLNLVMVGVIVNSQSKQKQRIEYVKALHNAIQVKLVNKAKLETEIKMNEQQDQIMFCYTYLKDLYPKIKLEYVQWAFKYSQQHEIDPLLTLSLMSVESSFYPKAQSLANARGLMQVVPKWWCEPYKVTDSDLYDPETNIRVGTSILKYYIEAYGLNRGLNKYNGVDAVEYKYSKEVLSRFESLKRVIRI